MMTMEQANWALASFAPRRQRVLRTLALIEWYTLKA